MGSTTRAQACVEQLSSLNPYVPVQVLEGDLSSERLRKHQISVVVATESPTADAITLNNVLREQGIAFVHASIRGVAGSLFCDFGPEWKVSDSDGEPEAITGQLML